MANRLFSLSLLTSPAIGTPVTAIDSKVGEMGDWIRFSHHQWFIWSNKSKTEISNAIRSTVKPFEHFIIVAVEKEYAEGMSQQWIWNWLNDKMVKQVKVS